MIKTKVTAPKAPQYPKLRKWVGDSSSDSAIRGEFIVLFTSAKSGTVVQDSATLNNAFPMGDHSDTWAEDEFVDFYGSVELSND